MWFAGQTYNNVTIKGANLSSTSGLEGANCPVTISVTMDTGSVSLGVNNQDQARIKATVMPDPSDPTETACVAAAVFFPLVVRAAEGANVTPAAGAAGSPCTDPDGNHGITVQILGAPEIQWTQNGTTNTISVPDDGSGTTPTPQPAIAGQQINLTTIPAATDLTALGLSFSKNKWTVGGANIGDRPIILPTDGAPSVSSASVTKTVFDTASLKTYWIYPNDPSDPNASFPATYTYCVDIPGLSAADVKNGLNCSLAADAAFNVTGPTAKLSTLEYLPYAYAYTNVTGEYSGCDQFLSFGLLDINATNCSDPPVGTPGMYFQGADISNVPAGGGEFMLVQLVTSDALSATAPGVKYPPLPLPTGLDGQYPYVYGTVADDSPDTPLGFPNQIVATETRRFAARMYLMWNPEIGDNPIAVPIGYVAWSFAGTAKYSTNAGLWSARGNGTWTANYQPSTDTGDAHGLPIWSSAVPIQPGATSLNLDIGEETGTVQADGEQENKQ